MKTKVRKKSIALISQAKLYPRLVRDLIDHCCIRAKTIGYVRGYDLHDLVMRYFRGKRHSDSYDTEVILTGLVDIGFLTLSTHNPTPDQLAFAGLSYSKSGYKRLVESDFYDLSGVKTHFNYIVDLEHPLLDKLLATKLFHERKEKNGTKSKNRR